jgi:hypothetical protein
MDTNVGYIMAINDRAAAKRRRIISQEKNSASASNSNPDAISFSQRKVKLNTVIGSNTSCTLKAAKELKKKKIYCISNVAMDTSCDELKNWIESCNISVLSIFEAKTKFKDSLSIRVCIDAVDAVKFESDDIWASNVIVRDWVFKAKVDN